MLVSTEEYKGYSIDIHYDESPGNPFTDWDGEPPIAVYDGGQITKYGLDILPIFTEEDVRQNYKTMLSTLGYHGTWQGLITFARSEIPIQYPLWEVLCDAYMEHITQSLNSERLELVEEAYKIKGYTTHRTTVTGCVQREWVEVLAVATPEWAELVGAPKDTNKRQLEYAAELYGQWAFGEVYGFVIKQGEEILESCWGFFGDNFEESGLLPCARSIIDSLPHNLELDIS